MAQHSAPHEAHDHGFAHVVPYELLVGVFASLMVLTFITVAATWVDLGNLNLWIAMGIATMKAALVVLYFMHLRYDSPFNAVVFVTALVFMWLFLAITISDTVQYVPTLNTPTNVVP